MTTVQRACCTSPAAIGYWFAASLLAWGVLSLAGIYWYPLRWYAASSALFAAGIGCIANWSKNRSYHCAITAPLFLIAAVLFMLDDLRMARINVALVWFLLAAGTCLAFCLEWRYAKNLSQPEK
jgi:hypothetical protein